MSHPNFGVFESEDPLDDLIYKTIRELKNPPRVPGSFDHSHLDGRQLSNRSKGFNLHGSEGFEEE